MLAYVHQLPDHEIITVRSNDEPAGRPAVKHAPTPPKLTDNSGETHFRGRTKIRARTSSSCFRQFSFLFENEKC